MNRRVAVTGVGVVSALGANREEFWQSLTAGRCGIAPIEAVDCSELRFQLGAEVKHFDPSMWSLTAKDAAAMDRSTRFAVAAAAEAVADSGCVVSGERSAVVTGCSLGGKCTEDETYQGLYAGKRTRFDPMTIPRVMTNAGASCISMRHEITGPCYTLSTACASAAHAIGQAFWMVRSGLVDVAVAGGHEAPFTLGMLRGWESLRVMSPEPCRPFSKDRRGLTLGEGAAMLVLEPLEDALVRGARIYAEVRGFGMSADAGHITMPSAAGAVRAMLAALRDASLAPGEIGYINAHGTGTAANDVTETQAIRTVFADTLPRVSSTKSMHGHALGASPALEAAATILALAHKVLPPTMNFTEADEQCNLDVIPNAARAAPHLTAALSNSFAFGGLNAVLAFGSAPE